MKRLIDQELACVVSECGDGVEVLQALAHGHVDLLVLDIEMPGLDGIDVLGEIRQSPELRRLPVLMLSKERRKETVLKFVDLGIDGYLTKPLRADTFRSTLDRLRPRLIASHGRRAAEPTATSASSHPAALVVDGDQAYRQFFVDQCRLSGRVLQASSGTEALALYSLSTPPMVFVGGSLGFLAPAVLARRVRTLAAGRPLYLVQVDPSSDQARPIGSPGGDYDGAIARTLDPERFRAELARLGGSRPASVEPLTAPDSVSLHDTVGDPPGVEATPEIVTEPELAPSASPATEALDAPPPFDAKAFGATLARAVDGAIRAAFTMIVDAELEGAAPPADSAPMAGAVVDVSVFGQCSIVLGLHASPSSMSTIAARMLGQETADITADDRASTAQELVRLVAGHTLEALGGESGGSCSEARDATAADDERRRLAVDHRCVSFAAPSVGAALSVTMDVYPLSGPGALA